MSVGAIDLFQRAVEAHKSGRLDEAVKLYKKVIAEDRSNAQVRYLLGCILMDRRVYEEAEGFFREAISLKSHVPSFHGAYGYLLMRTEREEASLEQFRTALSLPSAKEDVYRGMVNALRHFNRNEECLRFLDVYRDKFGHSSYLLKHYIEISSSIKDIKRLRAEVQLGLEHKWVTDDLAKSILCKAAMMEQRPDEALREAREWYRSSPNNSEAARSYADALSNSGMFEQSLPLYLKLFEQKPEDGELLFRIGGVYLKQERFGESERFLRMSQRLLNDEKRVYGPLSYAFYKSVGDSNNPAEIGTAYHYASKNCEYHPNDANAAMNLSSVLLKMLRMKEGLWYYKRSVDLDSSANANVSSRLFHINYCETLSREEVLQAHKEWNEITRKRVGAPREKFDNVPDPNRRLRIGFTSADFMFHPVSYFFRGTCMALAKDFDIYLYSNLAVEKEDDLTRQYQRDITAFRRVCGMSNEDLQRTIIEDGVDVLIDLSGHTTGNLLVAFAQRMAPVQIEWLGYPNTTGLDTMDYRISDNVTEPEGDADRFSTEKILRLPGGFHLYKPAYTIPTEFPLPALKTGVTTFGSFNNMKKVSPEAIELWCNLMKAVPNSRMVLKDRNLEAPSTMARIKTLFASYGIDFKRITTHGLIKNNLEHMRAYSHVDIALDSYPYTGTTTTCEALVMGCPVVTLAGENHASRVSSSILTHVGHPEWIAKTHEDFVRIGVQLASDTAALSGIRSKLRKELYASSLCNEERMRKELGDAIRYAWKEWCAKQTAS